MAELDLTKLRTKLFLKDSFLGAIACQVDWIADKHTPTAATDGTRLYVNTEWMSSLKPKEQLGVIAHECMHIVLLHTLRAKEIPDCSRTLYNVAADMCVNRELKSNGYELPDGCIECPRHYMDNTTEEIYKDLEKNATKVYISGDGEGEDGPSFTGNSDVMPTKDTASQSKVKANLNKAVIMSHKDFSKGGSAFAREVQKNLDDINRPTLPWDKLLRKYVNDFIKDDWSWARPNRRVTDIYLPSLSGESGTLGNINVYIDNSGSIDNRTIANFLKEIKNIHISMTPKNTQISFFSTEITNTYNIREHWDLSQFNPDSTGGTDIDEVVTDINKKKPVVSIIFTDGCFRDLSSQIKHPVIWVIFDNDDCKLDKGKIIYTKIV